jgi:hypothetical protein
MLKSEVPPTLEQLQTISKPKDLTLWGVYLLILKKTGSQTKLYGGSATKVKHWRDNGEGLEFRWKCYDQISTHRRKMPAGVVKAIADGYCIRSKLALCVLKKPASKQIKAYGSFTLLLESVLAAMFWTMRSLDSVNPYMLNNIRIWQLKTYKWGGLNAFVAYRIPNIKVGRKPVMTSTRGIEYIKEKREIAQEGERRRRANMTPVVREARRRAGRERERRRRAAMTTKEKAAAREKARKKYQGFSEEKREEKRAGMRDYGLKRRAAETQEERDTRLATTKKQNATIRARSPERLRIQARDYARKQQQRSARKNWAETSRKRSRNTIQRKIQKRIGKMSEKSYDTALKV